MSLEGAVTNGAVILDDPVPLPDGTRVRVEPIPDPAASPPGRAEGEPVRPDAPSRLDTLKAAVARARVAPDAGPTLAERLAPIVGAGTDLPADFAARHDHYIHGAGG